MKFDFPVLLYRGEQFNANFYYFAKYDIDHAFLLVEKEEKTLWVPKMNQSLAKELFDGKVIVYENWIKSLKAAIKGKKIGIDYSGISARLFTELKKFCKPLNASEALCCQGVKIR